MKVILIKDVANVGQKGSIKDISDGYAQNFLIARGLAEQATSEKIAAHESAQKKEAELHAKESAALVSAVHSLEGKRLEIPAKATEKGGLFKAIAASDIIRLLREKLETNIPLEAVQLEKPLKEVGEHVVGLKIGDAHSRITVVVKAV